jgi:hypothetical protein
MKLDLQTYNLRDDWKVAIEHLDFIARFKDEEWWQKRPVPYEWQENWVLAMLYQGVTDPASHPACDVYCPQWPKVIDALWETGHVEHGTLTLTEEGRKRIGPVLIKHHNRFPDLSPGRAVLPFKVHVAPMGSGNQVIEDKTVWEFISESMRKTLGLEMEAAAIGAVAHAQRDKKLDTVVPSVCSHSCAISSSLDRTPPRQFIPPPGEVCSCSPKGHRAAYRILDTGQCAC